jgi:hypothetical protein
MLITALIVRRLGGLLSRPRKSPPSKSLLVTRISDVNAGSLRAAVEWDDNVSALKIRRFQNGPANIRASGTYRVSFLKPRLSVQRVCRRALRFRAHAGAAAGRLLAWGEFKAQITRSVDDSGISARLVRRDAAGAPNRQELWCAAVSHGGAGWTTHLRPRRRPDGPDKLTRTGKRRRLERGAWKMHVKVS